jgi:hypothetical protein
MAPEKDLHTAIELAARVGKILHGLERSCLRADKLQL